MSSNSYTSKKKILRKQILQQARELYLCPQTDRSIVENLKERYPALTIEQVRELFGYLEKKGLMELHTHRSGESGTITAKGIDALDGAITVRGVEGSPAQYTRLSYKRDLRRRILAYCYSFQEFFNEDTEILEEFRESGYSHILLEEVRFHLHYLNLKELLTLKSVSLGGDMVSMARITANGIDIVEGNGSDAGVS